MFDELADYLLARWTEDDPPGTPDEYDQQRRKRRIVERVRTGAYPGHMSGPPLALKVLARPYAYRPDFRDEWRFWPFKPL